MTNISAAGLVVALRLLGEVIDPEGLLSFAAMTVGIVLVSFTDPDRFGWTQK